MSKQEIAERIHADAGLESKAEAGRALDAILESITEALVAGDSVQIRDFGSFNVSQHKARSGRNPQTGETIQIPAHRVVRFSPGKQLQESAEARGRGFIQEWLDFREFTRSMSNQLDQLKERIARYRRSFDVPSSGGGTAFDDNLKSISDGYQDARDKLKQLRRSGGEAWQELRGGLERAMDSLGEAFSRAKDKL